MRHVFRCIAAAAAATFALAAAGQAASVPGRLAFSGRLSDSAGLVTGTHRLEFRLYDAAQGGTQIWSESFEGVSIERGLVALSLGATSPLGPAVLDGRPLYLEVIVGATLLAPRLAIHSVPYSFRAEWAASAAKLGSLGESAVVTGVTAGAGLSGGGTGGAVTVSADTAYLQRRLSAGCPAGQFLTGVGADGSPVCAAGSGATYSAGPGLVLAGTTFSADASYLQRRLTTACAAGQFIQGVAADGSPACAPAAGGVQSVGATAPVASSGGANPIVSMPAASASADGYLRQADWSTFSAKQARVTGTCAAGSAVRAIAAEGTVTCQAVSAPALVCQEVAGTELSLGAGQSGGENVPCPVGTTVTGGGFYVGAGVVPYQGYANGNNWLVGFRNQGAATSSARGYAMCCGLQ